MSLQTPNCFSRNAMLSEERSARSRSRVTVVVVNCRCWTSSVTRSIPSSSACNFGFRLLFAEVGAQNVGVFLDVLRNVASDGAPEIDNENPVGEVHHHPHIVLH